jgi:hypothetical protein
LPPRPADPATPLSYQTPPTWLPCCEAADLRRALAIIGQYQDQNIGLADASLVILADRYRTDRLLTLDHRHFRVLRTPAGKAFTLMPGGRQERRPPP